MARNKEKQLGRLNRLWLQQLDEEDRQRNPSRPGLGSLQTAMEVQQWLPSIKKDIDYYLQQSQVISHSQRHIQEFSQRIEALTKEYRAYVRKLRELDPTRKVIPWTDRAYSRKHKLVEESEDGAPCEKKSSLIYTDEPSGSDADKTGHPERDTSKPSILPFVSISTPILDTDENYSTVYGYDTDPKPVIYNADPDRENLPLDFCEASHQNLVSSELHQLKSSNADNEEVLSSQCACSKTQGKTSVQTRPRVDKGEDSPLHFKIQALSRDSSDIHVTTLSEENLHETCISTASSVLKHLGHILKRKYESPLCSEGENGVAEVTAHATEGVRNKGGNSIATTTANTHLMNDCLPQTLNLPYSDSSSDGET